MLITYKFKKRSFGIPYILYGGICERFDTVEAFLPPTHDGDPKKWKSL